MIEGNSHTCNSDVTEGIIDVSAPSLPSATVYIAAPLAALSEERAVSVPAKQTEVLREGSAASRRITRRTYGSGRKEGLAMVSKTSAQ